RRMSAMTIDSVVKADEVATSSTVIERLVAAGFTSDQARQAWSRQSQRTNVRRSERLTLPRNVRVFAYKSFWGSEGFTQQVLPILKESRPGLFRLIQKLIQHGVLLRPQAEMLLASPITPKLNGIPSYAEDVASLEELEVARPEGTDTITERLVCLKRALAADSLVLAVKQQARLQVE